MRNITLLAAAAALTGCVSFQAPTYSADPDSTQRIKSAQAEYRIELSAVPADDDGAAMCRGAGAITVGDGVRYSDYIVDALEQDLRRAGSLNPKTGRAIEARYRKIAFQSSLGASNWYIHANYAIGDDSVDIDTIYNDRSSFSGDKACRNMAAYFSKAVAAHLGQLYESHLFHGPAEPASGQRLSSRLIELEQAHAGGLITDEEFREGRKRAIEGD